MAKNVLTIILSLLTGMVLLEIGLRISSVFFFPKMIVFDAKLGWKHATSVSKTFVNEYGEKSIVVQNAHGQRGNYYEFKKQSGKYRILALGDSFTDGQVNEQDLFSSCLERIHSRLEVVNAGVSGYGTVQEYLYLISEGLRFNPDLVLLMFFENDLTDNCLSYFVPFGPRPYATLNKGGLQIIEELDPSEFRKFTILFPFRVSLNAQSYLYYFLNSRIYHRIFSGEMMRRHIADLRTIDDQQKFEVFFEIIQKMRSLLRTNNIDFVIALIPTREDVRQGYSRTLQRINDFCQRNQIKCIPLLERFKKENTSQERLYYSIDMHWTRAGHKTAAEEIGARLCPLIQAAD